MSYDNPTPLRIGAAGTLNGWRVRVTGRLVLGVKDGGETYYWNEFVLDDDAGNYATLVFEETADGAEWKLFREFTPSQPLTAREAATKRVGDPVNLDGTPARITLVDQSRVYHIEGAAPDGVEIGDVANYFNVDTGGRMLVASWTGDEIEFYEGLDAPAESVADAFRIPRDAAPGTASYLEAATRNAAAAPSASSGIFSKVVLGLLGAASLFAVYSCHFGGRLPSFNSGPRAKLAAPALQLPMGAEGSLAQHSYVIDGRALVEIARAAGRHDRREYFLHDETGQPALLVNGLSGGAKEWHLFRSAPVPAGLTPYDAATKRKGAAVTANGLTLHIADLFQSKSASAEGPGGNRALPGAVQYGFVAHDARDWLIARWTENQIQFFSGGAVPEADVLATLGRAPQKKP